MPALREVLGTHVKQPAGCRATYLRFDFTHLSAVDESEIAEIEAFSPTTTFCATSRCRPTSWPLKKRCAQGAMALFGEKYGEKVARAFIPGAEEFFRESFAPATHVRATGDIGVFKITSDESIASGTRAFAQ